MKKKTEEIMTELVEVANAAKAYVLAMNVKNGYKEIGDIEDDDLRKLYEKVIVLDKLWEDTNLYAKEEI